MINGPGRLGTAEVAARLGVKPATVYAYVSRGLLHSVRGPEGSTFDPAEVERLARDTRQGAAVARTARDLSFVTRLTLIDGGRLYYRGRDAVDLARGWPFERVAWFLWTGEPAPPAPWRSPRAVLDVTRRAVAALGGLGGPIDHLRVIVAAAATADPLRHDRSLPAVAMTGRALLSLMVDSLPPAAGTARPEDEDAVDRRAAEDAPDALETPGAAETPRGADTGSLAARLWTCLSPALPTPARLATFDAALVLLADHELAASTLAARVAAAFRADPYAVVGSGLGPAGGPLHSGASGEVRELLRAAAMTGPERALGQVLDWNRPLPGFGQPLYPAGDPRATELLSHLDSLDLPLGRREVIADVLALGTRRAAPPPNVDFALGALEWGLDLRSGAGQALFVIGRTAGWLAHAMEEYQERSAVRVRATYVGPRPGR